MEMSSQGKTVGLVPAYNENCTHNRNLLSKFLESPRKGINKIDGISYRSLKSTERGF